MKWTKSKIRASFFLKLDISADHFDNIVSLSDLFDQFFRIIHTYLLISCLFILPAMPSEYKGLQTPAWHTDRSSLLCNHRQPALSPAPHPSGLNIPLTVPEDARCSTDKVPVKDAGLFFFSFCQRIVIHILKQEVPHSPHLLFHLR